MRTFYDIKNSPYNASGITNPNIWYWELTDVYYPSQVITEEEYKKLA